MPSDEKRPEAEAPEQHNGGDTEAEEKETKAEEKKAPTKEEKTTPTKEEKKAPVKEEKKAPVKEEKKDEVKEEKKSDGEAKEEGSGRRNRKRKSLWDTTPPDAPEAKVGPAAAAGISPAVAAPAVDPNAQLLLQQQQLLQLRALAQAKAEAAAAMQATQVPANGDFAANRIYVGSIFYDLTETDMLLAFSPFGQIIKIDMPKDSATGKHKGFCFIEFTNPDSATAAIATMNGCQLAGRQIKVNRPTNVASAPSSATTIVNPLLLNQALAMSPVASAAAAAAASAATHAGATANPVMNMQLQAQAIANTISMQHGIAPTAPKPAVNTRIYVGSIVYDLGETDVKAIFQAFGKILSCQLIPNPETGKHKGYGFVEFESEEAAKGAIQCMNGFQLGGRQLKVGWASSTNAPPGAPTPTPAMPQFPVMGGMPGMPGGFPSPMGGMPGVPPPPMPGVMDPAMQQHFLMQGHMPPMPGQAPLQPVPPPPPPASGRCVLLSNMVGPDEVDDDLQSEVTDECGKFGKVEKVVIYQEQRSERPGDAIVKIFVMFSAAHEGSAAQKSLNGRWFGGRQVQASFYPEDYFVRDDFTH